MDFRPFSAKKWPKNHHLLKNKANLKRNYAMASNESFRSEKYRHFRLFLHTFWCSNSRNFHEKSYLNCYRKKSLKYVHFIKMLKNALFSQNCLSLRQAFSRVKRSDIIELQLPGGIKKHLKRVYFAFIDIRMRKHHLLHLILRFEKN